MPAKDKNKQKAKRDSTPDKNLGLEESKTELELNKKQVIFDETIAKLLITEEDLNALDEDVFQIEKGSRSSSSASNLVKVAVRKEIPLENRKPPTRTIGLLRKAPPNATVKISKTDGSAGPRMTKDGKVQPHSILGPLNDYYRMALERGVVEAWEVPLDIREEITSGRSPQGETTVCYSPALPLSARERTDKSLAGATEVLTTHRPQSRLLQETNIGDADYAALKNWENKMKERKQIQGHISNLLQRPVDQLVMNSGERYRAMQEERYLIDRTLTFKEYGKGFRIGSEFWKQNEILRKMEKPEEELHLTLTRTEQGFPPSIEHVGVPRSIQNEKGIDWDVTRTPRYPWNFAYYRMRREQLDDVIHELDPNPPEIDDLEIIGSQPQPIVNNRSASILPRQTSSQQMLHPFNDNQQQQQQQQAVDQQQMNNNENENVLQNDQPPPPPPPPNIIGPSLCIGGNFVRWTGDTNSFVNEIGMEARVLFQSFTQQKALEYLSIVNDGTTVVRYYWKRLPRKNPFELVQLHKQRFYFDIQEGILLPGEAIDFPILFKADKAGIYTEQWHIETVPVLCGGALLMVTLRGIAQQEDFFLETRKKIEHDLLEQVAERTVLSIMDEVLCGIDVSERPRTPMDAYLTEPELFQRLNPHIHWSEVGQKKLTQIYTECFPKDVRADVSWSLATNDIRQKILSLEETSSPSAEDLAKKLYICINDLALRPIQPKKDFNTEAYQLCYGLMSSNLDILFDDWSLCRRNLGLSELELVFPDPNDKTRKAFGRSDGKQRSNATNKDARAGGQTSPGKMSRSETKLSTAGQKNKTPPFKTPLTTRDPTTMSPLNASGTSMDQDEDGLFAGGMEDSSGYMNQEETMQASIDNLCTQNLHQITYAWLYKMVGDLADLLITSEEGTDRNGVDSFEEGMALFH